MFGKSVFKLIKLALIAGIALLMGTYVLSAVAYIVILTRTGDFVPILSLTIFTIIAIRLSTSVEGSWVVISIIIQLTAVISSVTLVMVVFFGVFSLGIVAAILIGGSTAAVLGLVRDPSTVQEKFSQMAEMTGSMQSLSGVGVADRGKSLVRALDKSGMRVLVLPEGSFDKALKMLVERPQLPVVLTHFEDEDVLIIKTGGDTASLHRTKNVLIDYKITGTRPASPLHERFILALPLLEEQGPEKLGIDQFRSVSDEDTVKSILQLRPVSMSVHPSSNGLWLIVRAKDVFGLTAEEIPRPLVAKVVIGRDISVLARNITQGGTTDNAD